MITFGIAKDRTQMFCVSDLACLGERAFLPKSLVANAILLFFLQQGANKPEIALKQSFQLALKLITLQSKPEIHSTGLIERKQD